MRTNEKPAPSVVCPAPVETFVPQKIACSDLAAAPFNEPAASDFERRLVQIWERTFDRRPIGVEDSFSDLGGDSLLAIELLIQIEEEFGERMPFDVLLEAPTIRSMSRLLGKSVETNSSQLVTLRAVGSRPPLFCLPGISGSLMEFQKLVDCLGPDQPVYGLRPRGIDGRNPAHTSIGEWATDNIAVMRSLQPEGPYSLVGFSLGGVVAFEMARQLEAARQPIGLIALVDSQLCVDNGHLPLAKRLRLHAWKLWHNDEGGRWRYLVARWRLLVARLRRHNLSHQPNDLVLGLDCPRQVREMAMVHLAALQKYRPGIYHGPVTLFTAGARWSKTASAAADPTQGWAHWVEGHLDVHEVPATHTQMLTQAYVGTLAAELRARLQLVTLPPTAPPHVPAISSR
jgi:thioesterase domain-containing protein/acyl carrier protein